MKLVTTSNPDGSAPRLGVLQGAQVVDAEGLGAAFGATLPDSMDGLIDSGASGLESLRNLLRRHAGAPVAGIAQALSERRLLAPIPRPRSAIIGIGLNYRSHARESGVALPDKPVVFFKPARTVTGDGAPIPHDGAITRQLDWEVELAVIIGTRARRVTAGQALAHVFGYSVMIDISARDAVRAGQMDLCKGMDGHGPFGPWIVTADEIPDPQALRLWLKVNGETRQDGDTGDMLFGVAALIADLSAYMTLEPGDIIATGTPGGVGAGRSPPEFLWPGDRIEAGIDGIGRLRHRVIDDRACLGSGSA